MFLFGAKMELNGFIDFDKMLYLQGKMWYRYQKLYRNLMFERRKYLKELFNNFPISDIADDEAWAFFVWFWCENGVKCFFVRFYVVFLQWRASNVQNKQWGDRGALKM